MHASKSKQSTQLSTFLCLRTPLHHCSFVGQQSTIRKVSQLSDATNHSVHRRHLYSYIYPKMAVSAASAGWRLAREARAQLCRLHIRLRLNWTIARGNGPSVFIYLAPFSAETTSDSHSPAQLEHRRRGSVFSKPSDRIILLQLHWLRALTHTCGPGSSLLAE
jgi:hypothetical protein